MRGSSSPSTRTTPNQASSCSMKTSTVSSSTEASRARSVRSDRVSTSSSSVSLASHPSSVRASSAAKYTVTLPLVIGVTIRAARCAAGPAPSESWQKPARSREVFGRCVVRPFYSAPVRTDCRIPDRPSRGPERVAGGCRRRAGGRRGGLPAEGAHPHRLAHPGRPCAPRLHALAQLLGLVQFPQELRAAPSASSPSSPAVRLGGLGPSLGCRRLVRVAPVLVAPVLIAPGTAVRVTWAAVFRSVRDVRHVRTSGRTGPASPAHLFVPRC